MRIFTRPSAARLATVVCLAATWSWAAVPSPKDHFGFTPGDDYKLANYQADHRLFPRNSRRPATASASSSSARRSNGKPMYVAFISSAENLKQLRPLPRDQPPPGARRSRRPKRRAGSPPRARRSSGSIPACTRPKWRRRSTPPNWPTAWSPTRARRSQRIRRNVILMQVPVINPDGLDMVVEWYRQERRHAVRDSRRCRGSTRSTPGTTTTATSSC